MCHITDPERGLPQNARLIRPPSTTPQGSPWGSSGGASSVPQEAYQRMRQRAAQSAALAREQGYTLARAPRTSWEQATATHPQSTYRPLFETEGTLLLGWYRFSNGYEEIRDREGNRVWSDEIGLETPLITPLDLVGPGVFQLGGRLGVRFVRQFLLRMASRRIARGVTRQAALAAAGAVLARLRQSAQRVLSSLASVVSTRGALTPLRTRAQGMVTRLAQEGRRIVVNLGGEASRNDIDRWGELARHAINVNPLTPGRNQAGIPNLVRTEAENIGALFSRGQVDEIISMRLPPDTLDWGRVIPGVHRVLRPGGRITINFQGVADDAQAILAAMARTQPPFRNIENLQGAVITAIR
jgi:hypothetical protein